jgi:putative hemolysin
LETDYFNCPLAVLPVLLTVTVPDLTAAGFSILILAIVSLVMGTEFALNNLSTSSIENIEAKEDKTSKVVQAYIKYPERVLLTASIFRVVVVTLSILLLLPLLFQLRNIGLFGVGLYLVISVILILLLLFFLELIPRFISKSSESYLMAIALPFRVLETIVSPLMLLINNISGNVGRITTSGKHHISIEDISNALEYTADPDNDEEDILQGIVNFGNMDVSKILKPRIDVVAVNKDTDATELFNLVVDSEYSRIPVYTETFDHIIGILYVKDLLPHLKDLEDFDWNSLVRPAYFVPETKKVKELLKELQLQKIHMAVVVDEYGGTTGIVTLEDILEEIVGEIADESDEDEETYLQVDENTYIFDGITLLNDFYHITQFDESIFDEVRGDADTLAGLILELTGEIPENGDEIEYSPFKFIVEQIDSRRIKQVRVIINRTEEVEEEKL